MKQKQHKIGNCLTLFDTTTTLLYELAHQHGPDHNKQNMKIKTKLKTKLLLMFGLLNLQTCDPRIVTNIKHQPITTIYIPNDTIQLISVKFTFKQ